MQYATRPLSPSILRAYDIRGVVPNELSEDDLYVIGRAFAAEMHALGGKRAAVGYDGRLSSPGLEQALVDGLVASGIEVFRSGLGPSPMLYFATHILEADAGLMITGSHNPPEFNGLKMTLGGDAFFDKDILRLGRRVDAKDFVDGEGRLEHVDVFDRYVERLFKDLTGTKTLKVAWDPVMARRVPSQMLWLQNFLANISLLIQKLMARFQRIIPIPQLKQTLIN